MTCEHCECIVFHDKPDIEGEPTGECYCTHPKECHIDG